MNFLYWDLEFREPSTEKNGASHTKVKQHSWIADANHQIKQTMLAMYCAYKWINDQDKYETEIKYRKKKKTEADKENLNV